MSVCPVKVGDRVRITGVMNDPKPLPIGTEGTVIYIGQWESELTKQIGVAWGNGSRLGLLPEDPFEVIT
jgi:hypothetical protein